MKALLGFGVVGFYWSMLDVAASLGSASTGRTILGIWFLVFAVLLLAAVVLSCRSGRDRARDMAEFWWSDLEEDHSHDIEIIGELPTRAGTGVRR